jgi:hypothetical protein
MLLNLSFKWDYYNPLAQTGRPWLSYSVSSLLAVAITILTVGEMVAALTGQTWVPNLP